MTRFNINDEVKVRLTPHGREVHRGNFDKLFEEYAEPPTTYRPPQEDADGWSCWQLWELMAEFGPHLWNGCDPPFEMDIEWEKDRRREGN